jgi:DNA-binding NtrC family response regulator
MPGRPNLHTLVGHMKVEQLARLAGLGVEELVATVMAAGPDVSAPPARVSNGTPAPTRTRARRAQSAREATTPDPSPVAAPTPYEPPLAAMFGHVTHRELHRVVDRWLLERVLAEEGGNVSHAASRLGISRRTLREHRVRASDPSVDRWALAADRAADAPDVPAPPSLAAVLTGGGSYRDIRKSVDRWLIGGTLAREHGNVTRTASSLGMSRKDLRARWARVRD